MNTPTATPTLKCDTRILLDRIISWEKDLSEYDSLESILHNQFIIIERKEGRFYTSDIERAVNNFEPMLALLKEASQLTGTNSNLPARIKGLIQGL